MWLGEETIGWKDLKVDEGVRECRGMIGRGDDLKEEGWMRKFKGGGEYYRVQNDTSGGGDEEQFDEEK